MLTRSLSSGEVQRYRLHLASGDYARLEVVQQGLDVVAAVRAPSGSPVVEVDSPTGRSSTETVSLIAEEQGDYLIEIRAVFPGDTGSYRIALTARRFAEPRDRARVEAERADLMVGRCVSQGCPEGIQSARAAIERWHGLGEPFQEGRALFRLGQILDFNGRTEEALAAYEQALALQRTLNDREGMAATLNQIGRAHRLLGADQPAFLAFEESIALWREVGRPERAATVLLNMGAALESFGKTAEALEVYERALAVSREAKDRRCEAMALNSIGQIHLSLGQPLAALEELREALRLSRAAGRPTTEAQVLANLGALHRNLGMPHEALEHFAAAREIFRSLGDLDKEAAALNNLGILLFQLGALEDARELLLKALPARRAASDRAMTLVGLSWVAEALGDTAEASERLEAALKLQREVDDRAGEAETLRAQGLLLASLGETGKAGKAEAALRDALLIFEELGRPSGVAAVRRGLARVFAARGELDAARAVYEEARRQAEALGDVGAQALTLAEQGRLEHEDGKLPAARERLEAALQLMESFRSAVGGDRLRALHFATIRETYERYTDVLMQLHQEDPKAGLDLKAFEAAEQSRSRGLLDVLARARVDTREGEPMLLERELRLRQELSAKALLRTALADDPASQDQSKALLEEIETLSAEHRIVEALLTDGSRYASLRRPSVTLAEIQTLLGGDTVLLEYLLGERRSYLWIVSSTELQTFEVPGRKEIGPLARRLHEHLRDPGEREVSTQRKDLKLLSELVLGPALDAVAGKRLVIVADGPLQYVPFAALPVGEEPLLAGHEIVMLPSAAVLKEIRRTAAGRPPRSPSVAIVADPVYRSSGAIARPKLVAARSGGGLQDLPWSRREAEGIAAVAQGREVLLALGSEATRELVTSGRLDRFQYLHFATHGILDGEHPELSGLAFSQMDASGRSVDGFLRLQDLYSLHLQADLVVLSGCETGLGRELRGEGLVGLTHGFLHAGASQVVASLWPVRDRAAADLMQRFYRSMLRDGLRPAAALRAAQLAMHRQRAWRDPYFWAAFVAQGDWTAGGLSLQADTANTP